MPSVAIVNVTGYTGVELARLLANHPGVSLTQVTGRSAAGQALSSVFPHLGSLGLTIQAELTEPVDLAFLALPHAASAEMAAALLRDGIRVVDLSADFRLKDAEEYSQWYGEVHPAPQFLDEAVYGLPELKGEQVASARLVANPGCYPTCSILSLAPALKAGLIEHDIIIDAKSGLSGAGRSLKLTSHYSEVNESISAYSLSGHRHLPEIVQELAQVAGVDKKLMPVTFVPHLVPMTRGILSTCYGRLRLDSGLTSLAEDDARQQLRSIYREFYHDKPFVQVVDQPPSTKQTWGSNYYFVHPTIDRRTGRLVVIGALDNLVKGASGEAIQNMNLMLGLPETLGLEALPTYP